MAGSPALDILSRTDFIGSRLARPVGEVGKHDLGQFFTPASTARLMASMLKAEADEIRLLDPGAGVGTLTAAVIQAVCAKSIRPKKISATLFEIDRRLEPSLEFTIEMCRHECEGAKISFSSEIVIDDFIRYCVDLLSSPLFSSPIQIPTFNCAILNPPYKKISARSSDSEQLRRAGMQATNLYAGFLGLVIKVLEPGGELVAITPRSFCNGPYFQSLRDLLLGEMSLLRIHLFEARDRAFQGDSVLQENVILHAEKTQGSNGVVLVSSSTDANDQAVSIQTSKIEEIVDPHDTRLFIHIPRDEIDKELGKAMASLQCTINDLNITVSTGPVVDFRLRDSLVAQPAPDAVPLLYPSHLTSGVVVWPQLGTKKPNAILVDENTKPWLVPNARYVLVKRFSSKEEIKRVMATVYDSSLPHSLLGIENHLNYFHRHQNGLDSDFAKGLAGFLNSTLVDRYFRQFNGHTQVNASDLASLRYPSEEQLIELGGLLGPTPGQDQIDHHISTLLRKANMKKNPVRVLGRVKEAEEVLKAMGMPREQQNERSALTLLGLLDLKPIENWKKARNPLRGITPIMDFIREHYGRKYAPNTRETIRRFSVHQMLDAGILVANPDKPDRPINSPDWVYQVSEPALVVVKAFGTKTWTDRLEHFLEKVGSLRERYARERKSARIPVEVQPGKIVELSPGGQNTLLRVVITDFVPHFTPQATTVYLGDTDEKFAHFDRKYLQGLGVNVNIHGKMPDVILHFHQRDWLILVEAVTSHGPINPKRRAELRTLFSSSKAGLVYVTAFPDKRTFTRYAKEISWETEVWIAESPTHLVHFDGERFLGPYPED